MNSALKRIQLPNVTDVCGFLTLKGRFIEKKKTPIILMWNMLNANVVGFLENIYYIYY